MTPTYIKLFIGILLFATWVLLVVLKVPGTDDIIAAIKLSLAGLGAYHLNDRTNMPPAPPVDRQSGRASLMLLLLIALGTALTLSGCASFQQALTGYESSAAVSLDAANDNVLRVWKYQACSTPFSAVIRNPEVVPALKALCVPSGVSTPITLLDSVPATPMAK